MDSPQPNTGSLPYRIWLPAVFLYNISCKNPFFASAIAGGKRKEGRRKADGEGAAEEGVFLLLRTISHFTYEMVNDQSETARDGGFRERRTGCPLLPARPVEHHIPISLVKSDWKLRQKTAPTPAPFPPNPFCSVRQGVYEN